MAKVLYPITACLKKTDVMDRSITETGNPTNETENQEQSPKNEGPPPGLISKVSSGLFSIGSGAVGLGVGGVKWAASTTYNVGSGVLSASKNVVSKVGFPAAIKPKPKNE